jgi:hypothetical protein
MKFQLLIREAVTACALMAVFTTTSMVALAAPGRVAAELTVSGKVLNGEDPVVFVNGEASKSGRSIFSSSTVTTPEETTAVVSMGKTGRIELAPNSSMSLVFDDEKVDAELTAGTLTVLGSLGTINVRTNNGKTTVLNPGESISAEGSSSAKAQTSSKDKTWIWLLVAGGAAAAIIIAVSASGNGDDVVSPNR